MHAFIIIVTQTVTESESESVRVRDSQSHWTVDKHAITVPVDCVKSLDVSHWVRDLSQ